jgi:transcriptional regulator with XRE-family HTH domain
MKPQPDIRTILQDAIGRKRLQKTIRAIAAEIDVDSGNLNTFLHGKRDLGAQGLDGLCRQLGVHFVLENEHPIAMRGLLDGMREALRRYPGSRRAIAKHTEIDVGNLSRFSRGLRNGLTLKNLERLRKYLKVRIICTGELIVFTHRRVGWHRAVPVEAVQLACMEYLDLGFSRRKLLGRRTTDENGIGVFRDVPMGSWIDIIYGDTLEYSKTIEMIDNPQELAIEL